MVCAAATLVVACGSGSAAPVRRGGDTAADTSVAAAGAGGAAQGHTVASTGVSPRLQWLGNDGYCGEVSLIQAGLKFGQYLSQYDARAIATGNQSAYYLVGVNDGITASRVRLAHDEYPNTCEVDKQRTCSERYLAWVKRHVRVGHAVTITVYMNMRLFYGDTRPLAGDADYDHIVSVLRVDSDYDDDAYHASDRLTLDDHGLWAPGRPPKPQYNFTYAFGAFQGNRQQANAADGNVYTLPDAYQGGNFGIAHTGALETLVNDDPGTVQLLSVGVATNVNYEAPPIVDGSQQRPAPMPLTLNVTVSDVDAGVTYNLYEYDDEHRVPTSAFNAHNASAARVVSFTAGAGEHTHVVTRHTQSDQKCFFRAVRADAP